MILSINEKEYEVHFGMAFIRALDNKYYTKGVGNAQFGMGLEVVIPKIMTGDVIALAEILYEGTASEKMRPTLKVIDNYIDTFDDIDALFDEVIDELKKQNATKKRSIKILESITEEKKAE